MKTLAVKYRPETLDEVVGQESVVRILKQQLQLKTFKNAYLFCGKSGTGKTTCARAFAHAINSGAKTEIEIDAASNNGVDNIRLIVDSAKERSIDSEYKIYILDEVQVLTIQAWNALLKCIEEPPAYTIFILCATDPQKVPATILNRVQKLVFSQLSNTLIKDRLSWVCEQEGLTNYEFAVEYISKLCDGGLRDALSMLDKCLSYDPKLSKNSVVDALGVFQFELFFNLINAMLDDKEDAVFDVLDKVLQSGKDIKNFVQQFTMFCLGICKFSLKHSLCGTVIPENYSAEAEKVVNFDNPSKYYIYVMDRLINLKNDIHNTDEDTYTLTMAYLLKICRGL